MSKILYLCDGSKTGCNKRICYNKGGECRYTTDIAHAINFIKRSNGSYAERMPEETINNEGLGGLRCGI